MIVLKIFCYNALAKNEEIDAVLSLEMGADDYRKTI